MEVLIQREQTWGLSPYHVITGSVEERPSLAGLSTPTDRPISITMDQLTTLLDNALASAQMDAVDLIRAIYVALTSVV